MKMKMILIWLVMVMSFLVAFFVFNASPWITVGYIIGILYVFAIHWAVKT